MMDAGMKAAALIAHYLQYLAESLELEWTSANDADMQLLASLLAVEVAPPPRCIPPFEGQVVSDRVTEVFEREGNAGIHDPHFQRFRARQRWENEQ